MSDEVLAPILTIVLLAGLFAWVPFTRLCNDRCRRLLRKRVAVRGNREAEPRAGSEWAHD